MRRHAREEQRPPRVVHWQRVYLFEVAGRRHRPVEGAVELVDHLRRELLEVRLGVDDAVLGDLEQPRRLGESYRNGDSTLQEQEGVRAAAVARRRGGRGRGPMSRSFAAMISSTRSSPPLTFSASLRMLLITFSAAASSASRSLFSFLSDGISAISAPDCTMICLCGCADTVSVMPGKWCALPSSSCSVEYGGKIAFCMLVDGVQKALISAASPHSHSVWSI
mmetsp:Transcript_1322/g.4305  ORF Transcript_1322/g.4305 Transcript_1322/m.4305 type:complete len:222 (+) Transcript_1322:612-1277(+)